MAATKIVLARLCRPTTDTLWGKSVFGSVRPVMDSAAITLPSGHRMPLLGLGTWQAKDSEVEAAVETALNVGYRHFDTAFNYSNEEAIGRALKQWLCHAGNRREDLFIVTKLPHIGNRAADVPRFLSTSLKRLQLDYVDLYLVHMPFGFFPDSSGMAPAVNSDGTFCLDMDTDHIAVWQALEKQVDAGCAHSIGLSNFNEAQLEAVVQKARIPPSCLQVELHASLQQPKLRACCKRLGVPLTAFSPLGSPSARQHFETKYNYRHMSLPNLLGDPAVIKLAEKYKKSPAQILLRHLVQQGIVVIPKSSNPVRIRENSQIFDFQLSREDMDQLSCLDVGEKTRIVNFLFFKGIEKHPQYPFTLEEKLPK